MNETFARLIVRILAALYFASAAFFAILTVLLFILGPAMLYFKGTLGVVGTFFGTFGIAAGFVCLYFTILDLATGVGLIRERPWAQKAVIGNAASALIVNAILAIVTMGIFSVPAATTFLLNLAWSALVIYFVSYQKDVKVLFEKKA